MSLFQKRLVRTKLDIYDVINMKKLMVFGRDSPLH